MLPLLEGATEHVEKGLHGVHRRKYVGCRLPVNMGVYRIFLRWGPLVIFDSFCDIFFGIIFIRYSKIVFFLGEEEAQ